MNGVHHKTTKQATLAKSSEFENYHRLTREAELPVSLVPWVEFGVLIEPHNPKTDNDCPAIGVERMLRMFYAVD